MTRVGRLRFRGFFSFLGFRGRPEQLNGCQAHDMLNGPVHLSVKEVVVAELYHHVQEDGERSQAGQLFLNLRTARRDEGGNKAGHLGPNEAKRVPAGPFRRAFGSRLIWRVKEDVVQIFEARDEGLHRVPDARGHHWVRRRPVKHLRLAVHQLSGWKQNGTWGRLFKVFS